MTFAKWNILHLHSTMGSRNRKFLRTWKFFIKIYHLSVLFVTFLWKLGSFSWTFTLKLPNILTKIPNFSKGSQVKLRTKMPKVTKVMVKTLILPIRAKKTWVTRHFGDHDCLKINHPFSLETNIINSQQVQSSVLVMISIFLIHLKNQIIHK